MLCVNVLTKAENKRFRNTRVHFKFSQVISASPAIRQPDYDSGLHLRIASPPEEAGQAVSANDTILV